MSVSETFGTLLRTYRLSAGLTQEELAEASGVSARTISLLETGRRDAPRLTSARLLAQALALQADERTMLLNATTRHIAVRDDEDRFARNSAAVLPHQKYSFLPRDVPDFIGRSAELDRLLGLARAASSEAVAVTTIDGMAGVGKTAFAVHAAHALAEHYPDGQYFYDLHGFSPGRQPVDAATALEALLRMAGVPDELIPASLDERAAAWRAVLAGRRVLVVLDNVGTPHQVHTLLPGTAGSHVIVTSRRRMTAVDGARPISLGLLRSTEAIALFAEVVGRDRIDSQFDVVGEIVRLCGYLPMAVRIAAARMQHRPTWTVLRLVNRLRDRVHRLSELDSGDGHGVAAALTLSCRLLNADQQRLFMLLGLYPGEDFDAHSIAALADIPPRQAELLLDELVDHHLLMETMAGRYVLHELLRDHAKALATATEPPDDGAAAARLLKHQLSTRYGAVELIMSGPRALGGTDSSPRRA